MCCVLNLGAVLPPQCDCAPESQSQLSVSPLVSPVVCHRRRCRRSIQDVVAWEPCCCVASEVGLNAVAVDDHSVHAAGREGATVWPPDLKGCVDPRNLVVLDQPVLVFIGETSSSGQGNGLDTIKSHAGVQTADAAVARNGQACGHIVGALPDACPEPADNRKRAELLLNKPVLEQDACGALGTYLWSIA